MELLDFVEATRTAAPTAEVGLQIMGGISALDFLVEDVEVVLAIFEETKLVVHTLEGIAASWTRG